MKCRNVDNAKWRQAPQLTVAHCQESCYSSVAANFFVASIDNGSPGIGTVQSLKIIFCHGMYVCVFANVHAPRSPSNLCKHAYQNVFNFSHIGQYILYVPMNVCIGTSLAIFIYMWKQGCADCWIFSYIYIYIYILHF